MNIFASQPGSIADSVANCGEQPHTPHIAPSALMRDNEVVSQPEEQGALVAHRDARQLVRLVQCPCCSRPFTAPVTLPCGHTVCQHCLPEPQLRTNISYPNTIDHQLGISCPTCGSVHATAECSVDVTFWKVLELIGGQIAHHLSHVNDSPTLLEEVPQVQGDENLDEKEKPLAQGRLGTFQGGRLASTFTMAESGLLAHSSEVGYTSQAANGDDFEQLDVDLLIGLREAAYKELDCHVCYNIMLDPTTTACGHTFCRRCLARVMDHSSICPICRRGLHIPASLQHQPSNSHLVALLDSLCPDLVAARKDAISKEEQPGEASLDTPLFICTLSLPNTPTFLHIFEPRYRLMMRRCMEGNKRFGMVMYNRSTAPQGNMGPTRFLEYGTLLEIINYQLLPDGRSFVETVGVSRFRIVNHGMLDGYDVSRVERVEDISLHDEMNLEQAELSTAQAQATEFNAQNPQIQLTPDNFPPLQTTQELMLRCRAFVDMMRGRSASWLSQKIVDVYGEPPEDPAIFPYWFAAVLPIAEEEKYILLRTTSVRERLKIVYSWIKRIEGHLDLSVAYFDSPSRF